MIDSNHTACISLNEVHAFFVYSRLGGGLASHRSHSLIFLWVGNLTEADLVVGWLTRIPRISLISLWVGNLTEVGGVAGQMVSWAAQSAASVFQMLAENARLLISAQSLAMANGAASAFALPFPFNLAAWATVAATISGIFASLPKFATGGIVGGKSFVGDRQLIRANSGEMVITKAQQARLWSAISSGDVGGGQVVFKISGQELHGVLANYNSKKNRVR